MDDGSGDFVEDVSGNGSHGVRMGDAVWTTGLGGSGALEFVQTGGAEQYVALPDVLSLDLYQGSHSISAWFRPLSLNPDNAIDEYYTVVGRPGVYRNQTGENRGLYYGYGTEGRLWMQYWLVPHNLQLSATPPVPTQVWYHVVGVFDFAQGLGTLYVDGERASSLGFVLTASLEPPTAPWNIGISRPGEPVNRDASHGIVDDVRLYDRALTPAEVSELYLAGP